MIHSILCMTLVIPTISIKMTLSLLLTKFLFHKWKDNGEKIHKTKFKIIWTISFLSYLYIYLDVITILWFSMPHKNRKINLFQQIS